MTAFAFIMVKNRPGPEPVEQKTPRFLSRKREPVQKINGNVILGNMKILNLPEGTGITLQINFLRSGG